MTPAVLFVVLEVVAGCVIAWQSIAHLNRMSRCTRLPIVLGWVLLGGAAAAIVAAVLAGHTAPDLYSAATLAGVALLVAADKRRL